MKYYKKTNGFMKIYVLSEMSLKFKIVRLFLEYMIILAHTLLAYKG